MPDNIPQIPFRSYDEFRRWERAIDSLERIVGLVQENKNNVALCEELLGQLESFSADNKEFLFGLADEWSDQRQDKAEAILIYQTQAAEFIHNILMAADQVAQQERRSKS